MMRLSVIEWASQTPSPPYLEERVGAIPFNER